MRHVLKRPAQLFDGDILLGDRVVRSAHDALRPGPDRLEVLVALQDCKSCVPNFNGVEVRAGFAGHDEEILIIYLGSCLNRKGFISRAVTSW